MQGERTVMQDGWGVLQHVLQGGWTVMQDRWGVLQHVLQGGRGMLQDGQGVLQSVDGKGTQDVAIFTGDTHYRKSCNMT